MTAMLLAVLGLLLVLGILFDLRRRYSLAQAILSPLFYFSILWWLAFPFHALLLMNGWVDLQQATVFNDRDVNLGVILSGLFLIVIWMGMQRPHAIFDRLYNQLSIHKINFAVLPQTRSYPTILVTCCVSIALALYFLATTVIDAHWHLKPFAGNAQNIARVGNGPFFLLSTLFMFSTIAIIPSLVDRGTPLKMRIALSTIFAAGLGISVLVMLTLTTRSVLFLPIIALAIAWVVTEKKPSALVAFLILTVPIILAPTAQMVRYSMLPPEMLAAQPTQRSSGSMIAADVAIPSAPYCKIENGSLSALTQVNLLDHSTQRSFERPLYGRNIASFLCQDHNYPLYHALQTVASTFGSADHMATYLHKISPAGFWLGVDQGTTWIYNLGLSLLPRAIWHEKPLLCGVAIQVWLYPDMYKEQLITMTLPPSYAVDFIFGFGIFGALLLSWIIGNIFRLIQNALWSNKRTDITFALSLFCMASMFNLMRAGTGFANGFILFGVIAGLLYMLPHAFAWFRNGSSIRFPNGTTSIKNLSLEMD